MIPSDEKTPFTMKIRERGGCKNESETVYEGVMEGKTALEQEVPVVLPSDETRCDVHSTDQSSVLEFPYELPQSFDFLASRCLFQST